MPELPAARRARYEGLGLTHYDASVIVADASMAFAFDAITAAGDAVPVKDVANFVTGAYARRIKETGPVTDRFAPPASAADVAALLEAVFEGQVSKTAGRELLEDHLASGRAANDLLTNAVVPDVIGDVVLVGMIDELIRTNPKVVDDHQAGKPVTGFLVGRVMKATGGAADAARVSELVRERLDAAG